MLREERDEELKEALALQREEMDKEVHPAVKIIYTRQF
jgi:hypothetical protein